MIKEVIDGKYPFWIYEYNAGISRWVIAPFQTLLYVLLAGWKAWLIKMTFSYEMILRNNDNDMGIILYVQRVICYMMSLSTVKRWSPVHYY
jgi:hypothetical protein